MESSNPIPILGVSDERRTRRFLTPDEASAFLGGLNSRTVTRWAREGYLPAYPIGEGKRRLWRFLREDLERWMASRRQGWNDAA
ncbi:MAG: helix-turn-helix domain-containing protein [Acidobacteriota bacterium]|nr:helix-turn-helix domain-containing protein [Acidobacteriota bacterium]